MGKKRKTKAKPRQETVQDRLQALYDQHGKLTPDLVVEDAKNPDSILHGQFNWDVDHAAHEHWKEVARDLIRSVRLIVTTETTSVSCVAYVRDPNSPADEQGYLQVNRVRTDADVAREVLVEEFSRAASALARARELAAVFGMQNDVEELIEGVHSARRRVPQEARQ